MAVFISARVSSNRSTTDSPRAVVDARADIWADIKLIKPVM